MEAVSYSYLEKPTGGGGTSPPSSRDRVKGTVINLGLLTFLLKSD